MGLCDKTQVIMLGSKYLYLLSHLLGTLEEFLIAPPLQSFEYFPLDLHLCVETEKLFIPTFIRHSISFSVIFLLLLSDILFTRNL